MKAFFPSALLFVMFGCGGDTAPTDPTPIAPPSEVSGRIDGVWVMESASGADDPSFSPAGSDPHVPTVWTLVQSGSEVTGTSLRIAPFVVRDTGTLTGTMTGSDLKLTWVNVIELANPNSCNPSTTQTTATMVVTGDSMTGHLATRLPVCASRSFHGQQYTFRRRPLARQSSPTPIALAVTYRHPPPPARPGSTGCTHHFSPGSLFINMDGLPSGVRLAPVGERLSRATIAGAWPGEHWIMFWDIALCPPEGAGGTGPGPFVTSGVSIDGVELTRVVQLQLGFGDRRPALAFTLSADGAVQP